MGAYWDNQRSAALVSRINSLYGQHVWNVQARSSPLFTRNRILWLMLYYGDNQ